MIYLEHYIREVTEMTLTFGVLASVVKENILPQKTNRDVVNSFVTAIDPTGKYDDQAVSKLLSCDLDFPGPNSANARTQIVRLASRCKDASPIVHAVKKKVLPLIMPGREKHILFALKDIVRNDKEASTTFSSIFEEKVGMTVERFVNYQSFDLAIILAGLLLFTITIRNNKRGKETAALISHPNYWKNLKIGFAVLDQNKDERVENVGDVFGVEEYRKQCFAKYGKVPTILPTKDECQFEEIFVCTDIEFGVTRYNNGDKISNATIATIGKQSRRTLISAQGGNGKSMRFIYLLFDGLKNIESLGAIPFYVCLRFYSSKPGSLIIYMYKEIRNKLWEDLDFSVFLALINSGKVILLLDGLDEMSNDAYEKFKKDLDSFTASYRNIQIILSARPYMGWIDGIRGFSTARLCGLTKSQAIDLINRIDLYPDNPRRAEKFMRIFEEDLWLKKRDLASNPLLLCAMLCVFHEDDDVPLDGWDFFRRTFEIFASKHDRNKTGFDRVYETGLTLNELKKYLYEFAYETYIDRVWALDINRCREIYDTLEAREIETNPTTCEDFMNDLEKNLSIMQQDSGIYSFFQHAFQEYFTARYMAKKSDTWLTQQSDYFETNRERTLNDYVFTLLYDMRRDTVNESIILPAFRKAFRKRTEAKMYAERLTGCSKREAEFLSGYWSYILSQYPYFEYHKEEGEDSKIIIKPKSTILEFILHHKHYPSEKVMTTNGQIELEPESYFHDLIDGNAIVGDEDYAYEIDYLIHGQRVHYNAQRRKYIQLYDTWGERIELSRDIRFSVSDVLKSPSYNSELISYFEAEDFPLMKEYVAMRAFYKELKDERSKNLHSGIRGKAS